MLTSRHSALLALSLTSLALGAAVPAAHGARTATVGPGHAPGVAVDAGGTAYVAWKHAVTQDESDQGTRFCVLARNARGCSSPPVDLEFPGQGFSSGAVSVLLPAPGVVDVVVGRSEGGLDYAAYLARSTDGGRTFAPGHRLNGSGTQAAGPAELTADGRVALAAGDIRGLQGGLASADGADAETQMNRFAREVDSGFYSDVATAGNDVVVHGGGNPESQGFRLPAGAAPDDPEAWRALPAQKGGRGRVAGGPTGIVSMLDSAPGGVGRLYAQRLEGDAWGPAVTVHPDKVYGTELAQDPAGRNVALWTAENELSFARSDDGGALWSTGEPIMPVRDNSNDVSADLAADGRGAAAVGRDGGEHPIRIAWLELGRAPQSTVLVGDALVQVRAFCAGGRTIGLDARASRAGRQIAVSSVLRSARFGARRGRVVRARAYSTKIRLRSRRARTGIRATLRPRTGSPVTTTFTAVGCSARV